jgi:pimeloyl-ACP methyl ester carboxylesterase
MAAARAVVVLVHGLWTHGLLMELQRRYMANAGFDAVRYSYPSVRLTLTENASRLAQFARTLGVPVVHWVGHSLGGLIILRMFEREAALMSGRAVLLGSPYADTHSGRVLARSTLGTRMLGRSVGEWLELKKPARFPGREIGVIAGTRSIGLGRIVARDLPTPNDGAVAVAETHIAAACDRIELPVTHTGMLLSRRIAHQVGAFLRDGRFDHGASTR